MKEEVHKFTFKVDCKTIHPISEKEVDEFDTGLFTYIDPIKGGKFDMNKFLKEIDNALLALEVDIKRKFLSEEELLEHMKLKSKES